MTFNVELKHCDRTCHNVNDSEIAANAVRAIEWITTVPTETLTVTVRAGWVTLAGTLKESFQKKIVEETVRRLVDVRGVINLITIENDHHPNSA
jgi:osmotically-inducible protein OsmY